MKVVKVAAGVLNQTPMDWEKNKQNIINAINSAKEQNVSILVLPEMCITGYGCEDEFLSYGLHETAIEILEEIIPYSEGMIVSLGLPILYQNAVFNCAVLLINGEIAGFVAKRYLAGDGLHYEPRWFKPWPNGIASKINIKGKIYPIGDLLFDCGGIKIGFEICEDAWVADRPGGNQALKGVDIILNPSASHFAFSKIEIRKRFVIEGSRAFSIGYIYANLLGNEAGRAIYDGGALIATEGKLIADGERFSFKDFMITTAYIDVTKNRMIQARTASYRPEIAEEIKGLVYYDFDYPKVESYSNDDILKEGWESSNYLKEEEFTRAVTLALFDYLRKSYSNGFVVSLSGGADSSAIVILISLMVKFGIKELGTAGFIEKIKHIKSVQNATTYEEIIENILTTAYQATQNSGEVTFNAAKTIAQAVKAQFLNLDIDSLVKGYVSLIENAINRKLTWETDDVTLQNIQARVRCPSIWMIANIKNALLLSTSNRSEAAVGYATMDGDTAGGLSPIAGIDKAFLRKWLRWVEEVGIDGIGIIPELKVVNVQQPTAELRPSSYHQTDEDDLMPYPVLDAIEKCGIRDKLMPLDVFFVIENQFKQYNPKQLAFWIERFFLLWSRNQWKRERYAPSFHVDDENLDPKTWCRFPILSGSFKRELKILKSFIENNRK